MISFKVIKPDNVEEIGKIYGDGLSPAELDSLLQIAGLYVSEEDSDVEFAISVSSGCAIIRVFDMGRYLFLYPYEFLEDAVIENAIIAVSEYAMREELPLVFSDVPPESLCSFVGFRHINIDAEDSECQSYRVKIKTECDLISEIPEIDAGRVKLNAITKSDIPDYARLCKSENVNKYWGYDYREDANEPSDEYFFEIARRDFDLGLSLSLAIREKEKFVGEAILYAFDGRGGAEFAIRLLPEAMGKGLGRESVRAVFLLAESIGLCSLSAKVLSENFPSHAMLRPLMEAVTLNDGSTLYIKRL